MDDSFLKGNFHMETRANSYKQNYKQSTDVEGVINVYRRCNENVSGPRPRVDSYREFESRHSLVSGSFDCFGVSSSCQVRCQVNPGFRYLQIVTDRLALPLNSHSNIVFKPR
jgi:hypothetical protein